jgi:hypothetical protein
MASRRERRTTIGGQFAPRRIDMLSSPAYRVLSLSARRVLDRLEIEMAAHGGTDNGNLPCTFDDFQKYGIDRHAIAPAIREAEALGFIEVTVRGCAGNAEWRAPNRFRLTYRHSKHGKGDGTHEWCKIETIEEANELARVARKTSKSQWGKKPKPSVGFPHRNGQIHSGKTPTTGHSGKTPTTFDISGRGQRESGEAALEATGINNRRSVARKPSILGDEKNRRADFGGEMGWV